jgi:hypothetical protein
MQGRSKFIGSHPIIESHQYSSDGTANPVHKNKVKVRRTYDWLCPFDRYRSNKLFNVQRHINSVHGRGSGVPVDSRTGETSEDKVRNAITQRNFPNTLAPYCSHSDSIGSIQSDTEFGSNTGQKWNQSVLPSTLFSPVCASKVRMPFLESQEERVRQLGYAVQPYNSPASGPRNNYYDQTNRMTPYYEQNSSSSRTGNNTHVSKFQNRDESDWTKLYLNRPGNIQENPSINSSEANHTYQSMPFNPQNIILKQMLQQLAWLKQG